jgi:hypothetical protein
MDELAGSVSDYPYIEYVGLSSVPTARLLTGCGKYCIYCIFGDFDLMGNINEKGVNAKTTCVEWNLGTR